MNTNSRLEKTVKNTIFGMIGMFLMLLFSFISKSIFIRELGNSFNGIDYLFKGILNALNLAELGFASAISFALYKPLSIGDEVSVAAIMNFVKKLYRRVAIIIAIIGSCIVPFLKYFIKDDITTLPFTITQVRNYYLFYLANSVFSYFLAYKRTLILADQKAYIVTTVDYSFNILLHIVQIILLIITKNYYVFLALMLIKTIVDNIALLLIANKKYPYLLKYKKSLMPIESKKLFYKNVRAMLIHQVSKVIIANTSTIVVSAMVGVYENSIYGNYLMICGQVLAFINIIYKSVTASVGNLCVEEPIEKQIDLFNKMNYISLWIAYFIFICFVVLFNPFMDIWLGKGHTFNILIVAVIAFDQSINYLRKGVLTFRDAKGLFRKDIFKPFIEIPVGLILELLLGKIWGVFGIVLGYSMTTFLIAIPIEQWVLFKQGFAISFKKYIGLNYLTVIFSMLVTCFMYFITNLLGDGIWCFIIKAVLCFIIPNVIFVLFTYKTKEFIYFYSLIKSIFRKK